MTDKLAIITKRYYASHCIFTKYIGKISKMAKHISSVYKLKSLVSTKFYGAQ